MNTHRKFYWLKWVYLSFMLSLLTACGGGNSTEPTPPPIAAENQPPAITSSPSLTATEDILYNYQINVSDPDSSAADRIFTLAEKPDGMEISTSGLISWTPLEGVLTSNNIMVKVAENNSGSALFKTQEFTITVQPVNDQLQITSAIAEQVIDNGDVFYQQIFVQDIDDENNGQDIFFQLMSAPSGMTVSQTGLVQWTPDINQSNQYQIDIAVTDGGEDNTIAVEYTFILDVAVYRNITGQIANYFTGQNIADVNIMLTDSVNIITQTTSSASGDFSIRVLDTQIANRSILSAQINGFAEQSLILSNTTSDASLQNQYISLLPNHAQIIFDPNINFNLDYQGNTIANFSANSLEREDGQVIQGNVTAQLTIIDPSIDINTMPGDMLTRVNGVLTPIESFGAIDVILYDSNGNLVNLITGKQAQINIPIAANSNSTPDTIPLYYFDERQGLWIEEGAATKVLSNGQAFYQGMVNHFTTWNADRLFETVFVNGCVVDLNQQPIINATIRAVGRDYNGSSSAITDAGGNFSIAVRRNSEVLISGSQGTQSRTLSLFVANDNVSINECLILSPATSTIKLTWGEAPSDLDTHFFGPSNTLGDEFHVYFSNTEVQIDNALIFLDVDDTSSFGPEIVTIPLFPLAGRYQYIVYNYSGSGSIFDSPARVELNIESQIRVFSPPQGEVTFYWHVFDFVVDDAGNITVETVNRWLNDFSERTSVNPNPSPSNNKPSSIATNAIKQKYYKTK